MKQKRTFCAECFFCFQVYDPTFQHSIATVLSRPISLFEAMGYKAEDDVLVLKGPPQNDKLLTVARDCILANVECQVRTCEVLRFPLKVLYSH